MKRAPQPLARQTTRTSNSPSSQERDRTHRARTFGGPSSGMPCPNVGGTADLDTVLKLNPTGHETVLCSFTGLNRDGVFPRAGLIADSARNLYGTTAGGVVADSTVRTGGRLTFGGGCGTVFVFDAIGSGCFSGTVFFPGFSRAGYTSPCWAAPVSLPARARH